MEKSGWSMGGFGCTFFFSLLGCNWWNNPLVFFERTCCFYLWLSSTDDAHSMVAAFLPAVAARCPRYTQTQEEEEKRESLSFGSRRLCCVCATHRWLSAWGEKRWNVCVCVSALKVGQLSQSGSLMARREDTLFILIIAALGNYVSTVNNRSGGENWFLHLFVNVHTQTPGESRCTKWSPPASAFFTSSAITTESVIARFVY